MTHLNACLPPHVGPQLLEHQQVASPFNMPLPQDVSALPGAARKSAFFPVVAPRTYKDAVSVKTPTGRHDFRIIDSDPDDLMPTVRLCELALKHWNALHTHKMAKLTQELIADTLSSV